MFNLVTAVMAVALTALVVAGGVTYIRPGVYATRGVTETVTLTYKAFDAGVSAYRIANRGALPHSPSTPSVGMGSPDAHLTSPWNQIAPYLAGANVSATPAQAFRAPVGTDWFYGIDSQGSWLCVAGGDSTPDTTRQGVVLAAARAGSASVGRSCGAAQDLAAQHGGAFAATFRIQSGQ